MSRAERRRAERAQHGKREWRLPPQQKPVEATQRAPNRHARDTPPARDWAAEQKWVERIANGVVDTKIRGLAEPIGRALATIRTETRAEVKTMLEQLKAEILVECRRAIAIEIERIKDDHRTTLPGLDRAFVAGSA